jgi:ABC-type lipoprotein release transport system permease subunit
LSVPARLALRDLATQWQNAAALAAVFAIAVTAYVALGGYHRALVSDYAAAQEDRLVVQETQSFGEFYGSRLPPDVADALRALGVTEVIAEIHSVVGTSLRDAVLLKGIDLERYPTIDRFVVEAGRALGPGDSSRQAMIGRRLADRLAAAPGDVIRLRGRPFEVVGVFATGSYNENEAWVPLREAQELLGWGEDVSVYVVPDDGPLTAGHQIRPGVSVARRGELWSTFPRQWDGLMTLLGAVVQAIGVAAAFGLGTLLWKLAWRQRRDLAILRSLGFGRAVLISFIAVQGAAIAVAGGLGGVLAATALLRWARPVLAGVSLRPFLSIELLGSTALWLAALTALSIAVPVLGLGRKPLAELLSEV